VKITPNEDEQKKLAEFRKSKRSSTALPENDRFLLEVGQTNVMREWLPQFATGSCLCMCAAASGGEVEGSCPGDDIHGEF